MGVQFLNGSEANSKAGGEIAVAAGELHAIGARLVEVVALASGIPAAHGVGCLAAVRNDMAQGVGVQGCRVRLPASEVLGGGVLGNHWPASKRVAVMLLLSRWIGGARRPQVVRR